MQVDTLGAIIGIEHQSSISKFARGQTLTQTFLPATALKVEA